MYVSSFCLRDVLAIVFLIWFTMYITRPTITVRRTCQISACDSTNIAGGGYQVFKVL